MTFIGKILVIVLMAMSLVLLGISMVTLTTATDWKAAIGKENEAKRKVEGQLTEAKGKLDDVKGRMDVAQKDRAGATKAVNDQIAAHQAEIQKDRDATKKAQDTLLAHQSETKSTLDVVKTRNDEIIKLREQVAAVNEQAAKFKVRQEELEAEVVNLDRMLDAARRNSSQISKSH